MTPQEDTAIIAGQLADLTWVVEDLANQLKAIRERADTRKSVLTSRQPNLPRSARLQAAANALRESI
jgi:hypothetical protein